MMTIRVTCTCGKQFQVKEELAGKRGKCAACGQVLTIPAMTSSAALEKATPTPLRACPACWEDLQLHAVICLHCGHDLRTGKQVSQAKSDVPSAPKETVPSSSSRLWIALILGVICLTGGIAAFALLPRRQAPENPVIALKTDDAPGVPAIASKAEDGAGVPSIAPKAEVGAGVPAIMPKVEVPTPVLGSVASVPDPKIQPKQEAWQNDYTLFLTMLDKEVQRSNPLAPVIDHLFKGKPVRWTLKYQGSKVEKQELQLQFVGVPQNLTFVSSEKAAPNWGLLKAGTLITIEAKVMMAFVITLNPEGRRGTTMGLVIFEDTKLAEKENAWVKATPSQLLARLTSSSDSASAAGQKELKDWEQRIAIEGKTGVNYAFISVNPSIRNIQVKILDTHLGKPDRTTKELVAGLTVIPAEGGVAQEFPLETHWYGPVGFGFGRGNLQAIFYQMEKTDADVKAFPAPAGTYKYRIKTDIVSITTENGDLVLAYPTIKKEMERLIVDATRFDLTNNRDLTEYGKYVGEQLKLAKGKAIGFEIATESGKELFIGKLERGKSGEYEMTPSAKGVERKTGVADPKPASSPQFDTVLGYYAGVVHIEGGKVKSRVLTRLTIVGNNTEAKYDYGETKAGSNETLVWIRFHTLIANDKNVHFDKFSIVIDEKSYPVLASKTELNAEFAEAIRKATTQHGTDKSTYLLFAIPEHATKFRLVYADTGIDLTVPVPTVPEEVSPENAAPNPTPGRDGVGVSIFDRSTGKVGDVSPTATQKLLEFSLTLDLSRAAERDKVIKKWHELVGEKADRYTITFWAAEKRYLWPPAVPTLGK